MTDLVLQMADAETACALNALKLTMLAMLCRFPVFCMLVHTSVCCHLFAVAADPTVWSWR